MTETELKNEIKKGGKALSGIYFFYGEEDYMKNHYAGEMRSTLIPDSSTAAFNSFVFSDENAEISSICDILKMPAMMCDKKLIEVSLTNSDIFRAKAELTHLLEEASESPDTVLLIKMAAGSFDAGSAKKPSAVFKLISKYAKCLNFEYQTEAKLAKWLERHAGQYGVVLPHNMALAVIHRAGRSMYRLHGEIEKAAAYAAYNNMDEINEAVIDAVITKTDDEDAFRMANCILNGDTAGALICLDEKIRRREEPVMVLAQITKAFCELSAAAHFSADGRDKADFAKSMKMHTYRADLYYRAVRGISPEVFDRAVSNCTDADRLIKSSGLGYIAIERLICASGTK